MLNRTMLLTLTAVFAMFASVMMVIAVAPVVIEDASGRSSDAGFVTAVFSAATVLTDLLMPRLLTTRSGSWLLALGIGLIAVSAPIFAAGQTSPAIMMGAAAVRGVGFALGSVTASLFVINLAPADQRGRALGYYGVAATVPGIIAPSVGLLLLDASGVWSVFAAAAALAAVGTIAAVAGHDVQANAAGKSVPKLRRILRRTLAKSTVRRPFITSLIAMVAFGGVISFAPLALPVSGFGSAAMFFFIAGVSRAVARWASGGLIDRRGPTGLLIIGVLLTAAGCLLLVGDRGTVEAIVAAVAIGAGLGVVFSAGYLAMIQAADEDSLGVISTLWNLSIDGGVGVGAFALGFVAAASIDAVFVILPIVVALGLPVAIRAHRARASDPAS